MFYQFLVCKPCTLFSVYVASHSMHFTSTLFTIYIFISQQILNTHPVSLADFSTTSTGWLTLLYKCDKFVSVKTPSGELTKSSFEHNHHWKESILEWMYGFPRYPRSTSHQTHCAPRVCFVCVDELIVSAVVHVILPVHTLFFIGLPTLLHHLCCHLYCNNSKTVRDSLVSSSTPPFPCTSGKSV